MELNTIYNMDCLDGLKQLNEEQQKVDLIVTSPPYYNAREYIQWNTLDDYYSNMKEIFTEAYKCLNNHRYLILNVSDITGQVGKQKWTIKKIPLGAYFTIMMEEIGFLFIDDFIWDKGEPQSKRHVGNPPFPFYQYPLNCYEHIFVFAKHEFDKTKLACPVCNQKIVVINGKTSIGVESWECKNPECSVKSESNRGKRFSARSLMMENYKQEENMIPEDIVKKWRKDIVKINPVIKINPKGENIVGHSAPFPTDIPEMAIRYFSGVNDIVMDIFTGSGTTQLIAKKLNRKWLGFEINKGYCDLANSRVETNIGNTQTKE